MNLITHREGFAWGRTPITTPQDETGIAFSTLRMKKGEIETLSSSMEMALLHMSGSLKVEVNGQVYESTRSSLFDEAPFAVHTPQNTPLHLEALTEIEVTLFETENPKSFAPQVYTQQATKNEHRGRGQVDGACYRFVRTIFDGSTSDPNTELVLGEVVNFPGRWSSYPPHHHPQPEIYHYRFSDLRGYGHAELGDDVFKVQSYDTVKILDERDHAQCSAPGYAMYYIWVIRHLHNNRYTVPEFTADHAWTQDVNAPFWKPRQEALV